MAKVKGPLFSLEAKNQVGKSLIYSTRKGKNIVRAFNVPKKVKTIGQELQRARYSNYRGEWRYMETARKAVFNQRAIEQNRISGYHQFLHENLDLNRKGQLYLDLSCVRLWHFNEQSGSIAYDGTRNHNDGNITGATRTPGKFNGALSFNGNSDYVDCGNDESLNAGIKDWSIEKWIKIENAQKGDILAKGNGYRIKITSENKVWVSLEGDDRLQTPIFATSDGTHLYIIDTYNHRIVKRLLSDLSYVAKIGSSGSGNDQFYYPQGATSDGTHLYITDTNNHRIVKRLLSDLSYVDRVNSFASSLYSSPLSLNWHKIDIIIDNYNMLYIYIDGLLDNSIDISYKYNHYASLESLKIGSFVNFFNGSIDEVAIYNRAKTPAEIKASYDLA